MIQGADQPTEYWFTTLSFSWVPLIAALWVGKLFNNLLERTVTSVKVVYFTVFYTKITHPERIMDELQQELTDYLKLEQVNEVQNVESQPAAKRESA